MISKQAYLTLENEGRKQGLMGRKLRGFIKSQVRKIIKRARKEGKI
jgi:hypothetical protein